MTDVTGPIPICPYRKSDMTPCVIDNGKYCYAMGPNYTPICVGCERGVLETGVDAPDDWELQVAQAREENARKSSA